MRVLVTGGAGFIGSALVDRLLAEGHEVDVVDDLSTGNMANLAEARAGGSGRLKFHQADVRDDHFSDLVARRTPDRVAHLAGATAKRGRSARGQLAGDLTTTVSVLEAAARSGVTKVVTVASARGQADEVAGIPARAAHEYLQAFHHRHGLAFTTVVLPTVYGRRQTPATESSVVAVLVARIAAGEPCVVHGAGTQSRDLLHVDDAVDALVRALDRGDGQVVEIGTGVQTSVKDLVMRIAAVAGVEANVVAGPRRAGDPDRVEVDPGPAQEILGWRSWTAVPDGLADAIASVSGASRT